MHGSFPSSAAGRGRDALIALGVRKRFRLQATADGAIVATAALAATFLRMEFEVGAVPWTQAIAFASVLAVLQVAAGMLGGLYAGAFRFGSFDEVLGLARALTAATVLGAVLNRFVLERLVPVSASLMAGMLALLGCLGMRYVWRLLLERRRRPRDGAERVVVVGAGEGGAQAVTAMLRDPESPYLPVALVDDDPNKVHLRISGVPVCGRVADLAACARATGATAVVVAVPSAGADLFRAVNHLAAPAGLRTLALPPVADLLGASVAVGDIRPVTEEDLLGRRRIELDLDSIADYVRGRRVLVTGAGGSIGSELCRQLHRFGPEVLVMLDRDESGLHSTQLSIDGRGQLDTEALVVADIRDAERLHEVWETWRPHVVFHAAALKHVPLLEMHPDEAVKTNVAGTRNVLRASADAGVERFVNISTDKAADPINVLGRTKLAAEMITAEFAASEPGTFVSVRFGNVLGSRGSVLTAFRRQIAEGGPVTVTHPEITRYFMTVEEAVGLVIQAGAIGDDGEVLILDMGNPIAIDDVARQMIEASGKDVEIAYTGLRVGEKLHEVLIAEGEQAHKRDHPLIWHVRPEDIGRAGTAAPVGNPARA